MIRNAQPIVVKTAMGPLGIVHNGNLVNADEIRARLEREGSIFQTTSDTEVILHLMARNPRADPGRAPWSRRCARCAAPTRCS